MRILGELAEALAPGQGEELLRLSEHRLTTNSVEVLNVTINNEMVQNLKQLYDVYVEQKVPLIEKARLLSLLPRNWKYETVMEIFGCSKNAIEAAHHMHDDCDYMLQQDIKPAIREKADPEKVKHFVNWLIESETLVSGSYRILFIETKTFDLTNG
jgi:hypothetical protein